MPVNQSKSWFRCDRGAARFASVARARKGAPFKYGGVPVSLSTLLADRSPNVGQLAALTLWYMVVSDTFKKKD